MSYYGIPAGWTIGGWATLGFWTRPATPTPAPMTDAEFIKARVHDAVAKIKPTVVPLAFTKCRWCNRPLVAAATMPWWVRVGFCSHACVDERYDERGD